MRLLAIKDTDKFGFQECVVNHLIKIAEKSKGSITSPNALQDRMILQTLIKQLLIKQKGRLRKLQEVDLGKAEEINEAIDNLEKSINYHDALRISRNQLNQRQMYSPKGTQFEKDRITRTIHGSGLSLLIRLLKDFQIVTKDMTKKEGDLSYQEELDISTDIFGIYTLKLQLYKDQVTGVEGMLEGCLGPNGQLNDNSLHVGSHIQNEETPLFGIWSFFKLFYDILKHSATLLYLRFWPC